MTSGLETTMTTGSFNPHAWYSALMALLARSLSIGSVESALSRHYCARISSWVFWVSVISMRVAPSGFCLDKQRM
jgi:hypothetical protein